MLMLMLMLMHVMGAVPAQGLNPTLSIFWNIAELSPLDIYFSPLVLLLLPWLYCIDTTGAFPSQVPVPSPIQSEFQRVSSLRSARGMGPEFLIQGPSQPYYSRL